MGFMEGLASLGSSIWDGAKNLGDFAGLDGDFGFQGNWTNGGSMFGSNGYNLGQAGISSNKAGLDFSKFGGMSGMFGGGPSAAGAQTKGDGGLASWVLPAAKMGFDWHSGNRAMKAGERAAANQLAFQKQAAADQLTLQNKYFNTAMDDRARQIDKEDTAQDAFNAGFSDGGLAGLYAKKKAVPQIAALNQSGQI